MGLWRFIARGQGFSRCWCGNAKFPFVHEQTTAPAFVTGGQRDLPLDAIVFFLDRLGWVDDGSLAIDLASGLSAATLASFEAWAVADGRLKWSATSQTGFLRRVLTLAAELTTGVLPAALKKVTADSFVPFIGHNDAAGGPD